MNRRALNLFVGERDNYEKPLTIAEIGVDYGTHAMEMLAHLNVKKMYLVDPYESFHDCSSGNVSQKDMDVDFSLMFKRLMEHFDFNKVVLVRQKSAFASTLFPDEFFDFVYIDARHDYEPVKEDITLWWPKVKVGGIIGGHDYTRIPFVERAVKEFAEENKLDIIPFLEDIQNPEWGIIK
jgi:predicted O-methyltransferase YrrM